MSAGSKQGTPVSAGLLRPPRSCLVLACCPFLQFCSYSLSSTSEQRLWLASLPLLHFFRTITITLVPTDDSGSVPSFKVLSLLSLLPRRSGYLQIVGTQVLPLLKGGDITVPSIIQSLWGPWSSRVGISAQFWLWSPWSQPLAINLFSLTGGAKSKTERHEWWESLCCYWESIGSFVIESW